MIIHNHITALCPGCGKDSWQSEYEAHFITVRCIWCGCKFKWDQKTKSYKVVSEE